VQRNELKKSGGLRELGRQFAKHYQLVLLLIPAIIYLLIFSYWPMYGVQISFRDYRPDYGFFGSEWLGLKHFERFLTYPDFARLISNTITITVYRINVNFPIPIVLAIMLNEVQNRAFKKTVQTLTYMPHFISTVVVCGMITMFLNKDTGIINILIKAFGGEAYAFMTTPSAYPHIHVWSGVWQNAGYATIIYIATLSQVDASIVEAAVVDGASHIKRIWHVDIPHLMPTVIIQLLMSLGTLLTVGYEKVILLQNDLNMEKADVISTYVYRVGLLGGQFSYTSAIGLINTFINLALLLVFNSISRKYSETSMF